MLKKLKITLYSDLCAGVGKGFAAVIDNDTALDDYGIPFIPGKRLKGCMREVAKVIGVKDVSGLFGYSGNDIGGSLSISNAKISGYKDFVSGINASPEISARLSEYFCSVRAETAIENDTAKDNSLRFIRVVNQNDPRNGEPLIFEATISFDDKYENDIVRICKGLRNIGYHRNRGFGAVKCSLEDNDCKFELKDYNFANDKEYEIRYTVYLDSDLMLPASNADKSLDYIPGTSVLGAFAAKYVKSGKAFNDDIFLSGNVKFGNLYVSDKNGTEYVPAPGFMGKYKAPGEEYEKLHGVKNFISEKEEKYTETYVPDFNCPAKKLFKKGYLNIEKGYKLPETKTVYHNNLSDNDGGLYIQYCVCSDQYFSGRITGKGECVSEVYKLFGDGVIAFGRSKTAQYSRCIVASVDVDAADKKTVSLKKGQKAAYLCESGVVLCNDCGINDISVDAVSKALYVNKGDIDNEFTRITSSVISGYNAKWNLKKPQFPVINAGSVIVFTPAEDIQAKEVVYIGEKQNEGFGRVRLIPDAKHYLCENKPQSNGEKENNGSVNELLKKFSLDNKIIDYAIRNASECRLGKSQVGRVTLMCKEADSYDNFIERINSIKTESTRNDALNCFSVKNKVWSNLGLNPEKEWNNIKKYILTLLTVKKYKERGSK